MTLPYVYKLTDLTNGKWYIGCRVAKGCCPEDLGVKYFTSSKLVAPMFKADSSRFKAEILVISEDADYIVKVEADMLKFRNAKDDPESYNMGNADGKYNASKSGKRVAAENMRLGKAIFAQTREQRVAAGRNGGLLAGPKGGKTQGNLNRYNGVLEKARSCVNKEKTSRLMRELSNSMSFEFRSHIGKLASSTLFKCNECDMITNAGSLGKHQKASGHIGKEHIK